MLSVRILSCSIRYILYYMTYFFPWLLKAFFIVKIIIYITSSLSQYLLKFGAKNYVMSPWPCLAIVDKVTPYFDQPPGHPI